MPLIQVIQDERGVGVVAVVIVDRLVDIAIVIDGGMPGSPPSNPRDLIRSGGKSGGGDED